MATITEHQKTNIHYKPTDKLELILLPPKEPEEITEEKIKNFYKNLVSILMEED